MTDKKRYDEVMAEREQYPLGKPRPYMQGHPDLMEQGLSRPSAEGVPLFSGWSRLCLVLLALLAARYGVHGLLVDDLYLPAAKGSTTCCTMVFADSSLMPPP